MKLPFLRLLDNPLSKLLTLKITSCMQWLFWVTYQKYKEVWDWFLLCIYCMTFLQKCSLSDTPYMDKVSMSNLFSFSTYQTKCVAKLLFRQLMTSWTLRFIFDHPRKQWPTGRKRGKDRNRKNQISREWKEFSRWNKKHFS